MNGENACRVGTSGLLWSGAILAASAAFGFFVTWPQMVKVRALAARVQSEKAELASRYQSLEVIAQAQKSTAALTARVADFDQRIPAESKVGDFLEELARLVQNRDLRPETVQPGEPIRSPEVIALPIAIKVHGSFSGIHGLLQDIEHLPRLTRFDQFNVILDPEHPGDVTADMNLKIFFLPPSATPATPAAGGSEARTG